MTQRPTPPGKAVILARSGPADAIARTAAASSEDTVPPSPPICAAGIGRLGGVALQVLAVALGGFLRFSNLGGREMSADEGASWAAASASSV
ncbi:MAG: hypothetical protein JOZ29_00460, partial [Deltaproteobacteria bacterium]|nr:hypothetical protein [Deltaproteobacteria bacterium]